nr:MAG TPA: hypothetical protein [Caudoviricetes sp.]
MSSFCVIFFTSLLDRVMSVMWFSPFTPQAGCPASSGWPPD